MAREPIVITLDEPIQAHGKELTQLSLRPPRGKDLREAGSPFQMLDFADASGQADLSRVKVNTASVLVLIGLLAEIPPSSVDQLGMVDIAACEAALFRFLAPASAAS